MGATGRKHSLFYFIFQQYLRLWHLIYYRSVRIIKHTTVPPDYPAIFAPNHQNALMDPLAILLTDLHQPYFLARADIFKNKYIAKFLNRLKILPVYRIRDGADNLSKNDEIFQLSSTIFEKGSSLGIFPEANHSPIRSLRPLKKGIPRIAFLAEEENQFKLGLKIIPVGIYYSDIRKINQDLILVYGKPIAMIDFKEEFELHPAQAMNSLRSKISESIRPLMVDIDAGEENETFENLRLLFCIDIRKSSAQNYLKDNQDFIAHLHEFKSNSVSEYEQLKSELNGFINQIKTSDSTLRLKNYLSLNDTVGRAISLLNLLLGFPAAIPGNLIFALPHLLIQSYFNQKIKDVCFVSTLYFSISWVVFTFWILGIAGTTFYLFDTNPLIIIPLSILSGWFSLRWNGQLRQMFDYFGVRRKIDKQAFDKFMEHWKERLGGHNQSKPH